MVKWIIDLIFPNGDKFTERKKNGLKQNKYTKTQVKLHLEQICGKRKKEKSINIEYFKVN